MARRQVIAYYIQDAERTAAVQALSSAEVTDSFAVGEIEESDISQLEQQGVIVRPLEPAAAEPIGPQSASFGLASSVAAGESALAVGAVPAPVDYYYVQLRGPLLQSRREALAQLGVSLLERTPGLGFKARLSTPQVAPVAALPFVADVRWIGLKQAAPRALTAAVAEDVGPLPAAAPMLTWDARLHTPDGRHRVEQWLADHQVPVAGSSDLKVRLYALAGSAVLTEIQSLTEVELVVEYVPPTLFNDVARRLLGMDAVQSNTATAVLKQDGHGQIIAVADTGIDDQHPDFQGRITKIIPLGRPNDWADPDGHGTHVAGSAVGDGTASGGQLKGTAPHAQLFFQSLYLDADHRTQGLPVDLNTLFDQAYQAGARIHNNSWGARSGSQYTLNSEEVDQFVGDHRDMLVVLAAGNFGSGAAPLKASPGFVDWLSISSPASCKNAVTVGASRSERTDGPLASTTWGQRWPDDFPQRPIADELVSGDPSCLAAFSSRGPCDDHRIKPDLVAPGTDIASTRSSQAPIGNYWGPYPGVPGQPDNPRYAYHGGTSMAAPLVAGCAALVRQYYIEERQHPPSAALLKATLVNSTVWLSGADSIAPSPGQPNYHQGHGRLNMGAAIPNSGAPGLVLEFVDNWQDNSAHFLMPGDRKLYQFSVPAGSAEVRMCMAYTDLPARGLQNNLNLVVQLVGSNKKWLGNAQLADALTIPDGDNNLEVVRMASPAAGDYVIQVFAANMLRGPQDFALVVTGAGISTLTQL